MSPLDELADRRPSPARILTLDIERLIGKAEIDFWELGDIKRTSWIRPEQVTREPITLCVAAKWLGEDDVIFHAAWTGHKRMTRAVWKLYDQADIVVGFNSIGFDTRHLATDWNNAGLLPPSPFKEVDLYRTARQRFNYLSKSLRYLLDKKGLDSKGHYNAREAERAMFGDEEARESLRGYNEQDVRVTEALYLELLPWITNHPNMNLYVEDDARVCPYCGRENTLAPLVSDAVLGTTSYAAYRCDPKRDGCGGVARNLLRRKHTTMRSVR